MSKGDTNKDTKTGPGSLNDLPGGKDEKDKKKKKSLDQFSYYLAWIGFLSIIGSALVKLVKSYDPPKKDDYVK
jgi:hypothetical protein